MTLLNFIKKRPYLFWSTKNYKDLSEGAVVEAVLNYGDFDDVQKMFGNEFNEKLFRSQLVYFKDIDYSEQVSFLKGLEKSDEVIKKKLIEFSLKKV